MNRAERRARKSDPTARPATRIRRSRGLPVLRIELPSEVYDRCERLNEESRSGDIGYAEHDERLREQLRPYAPIDRLNVSETDLIRNPRLCLQGSLSDG